MRSLLRSVVQRKEGGLVGRTLKVGPYSCRVEAHLGDGGSATIYRVRDTTGGAVYALKHVRLAGEAVARADCETEIDTMKRLRGHPNILTLRAVAYTGPKGAEQEAFLLLDLCRDSLVSYMQERNGQLSDGDVLSIFHSVAKAVAVMHHQSPPIAHRDLKAENILLHNNGTWVLCDFGSASSWAGSYDTTDAILVAEEHIRKYTTPAYRAPEMFDLYSRVPITTSADLWALGVLFFLLCYGRLPFSGDCKLQVLNGEFSLPPGRPAQYASIIQGLLVVEPHVRSDINEVLRRLECLAASLPQPMGEAAVEAPLAELSEGPGDRQHAETPVSVTAAVAAGSTTGRSPAKAASPEAVPAAPSPVRWPRELSTLATLEQPSTGAEQVAARGLAAARPARGAPAGEGAAAGGAEAVGVLQQQVVKLTADNAELRAVVSAQQATIQRMQAEASEQAAVMRQLQRGGGCSPPQRGHTVEGASPRAQPPVSAGGWVASFDSDGAGAPPSFLPTVSGGREVDVCQGSPSVLIQSPPLSARHRRITSEPTAIDRWGPAF